MGYKFIRKNMKEWKGENQTYRKQGYMVQATLIKVLI